MPVQIGTICNNCEFRVDMWVDRDLKGKPTTEGVTCGQCGKTNCIARDWSANEVNGIIPPSEDGQINRFEYSFTDVDGKKHSKKLDPYQVRKHFEKGGRK